MKPNSFIFSYRFFFFLFCLEPVVGIFGICLCQYQYQYRFIRHCPEASHSSNRAQTIHRGQYPPCCPHGERYVVCVCVCLLIFIPKLGDLQFKVDCKRVCEWKSHTYSTLFKPTHYLQDYGDFVWIKNRKFIVLVRIGKRYLARTPFIIFTGFFFLLLLQTYICMCKIN